MHLSVEKNVVTRGLQEPNTMFLFFFFLTLCFNLRAVLANPVSMVAIIQCPQQLQNVRTANGKS